MDTQPPVNPDTDVDKAARARLSPCWSCRGPVPATAPFCPTCDAVQPPGQADHFARLGLDMVFDVDPSDLERRYFDLQRRLHPDRFATRSAREKAYSMQQATSLNEAYECLKEPLSRADYLVHLRGIEVLPDGCNLVNDQQLLMEAMEMREALAEAERPADVDKVRERAQDDIDDCLARLSRAFAAMELEMACRLTTRLKYLVKLDSEAKQHRVRLSLGA